VPLWKLCNPCHEIAHYCVQVNAWHALFPAPQPECTKDPECRLDKACIQQRCENPCTGLTCGINAECKVRNHRALCICKRGFEGNPQTICEERERNNAWCLLNVNARFSFQLVASMTQNAEMTRLASTGSVRILAFSKSVGAMPFARLAITGQTAFVLPTTLAVLSLNADPMSVWLTLIATSPWLAGRRSVWILVHAVG